MSSRDDRRRRERSWERDHRDRDRPRDRDRDRDRDRPSDRRVSDHRGGPSGSGKRRESRSRSRSPRRDDSRRHERDRGHDRRERNRQEDRPREDRRGHDKVDRRDSGRRAHDHDREHRAHLETDNKVKPKEYQSTPPPAHSGATAQQPQNGPNITHDVENEEQGEPGEEIEPMGVQDDSADIAVLMGFGGFDSTKGKPVQGNQEGAVNIKKPRTWRQYMNRRGGFNRPLDKIK